MGKRLWVCILMILLLTATMGCSIHVFGGDGAQPESLTLGTKYLVQDVAEITLVKVENTTIIRPAISSAGYAAASGQYIDIVLDVKNLRAEEVNCNSFIVITAEDADGNVYKDVLYAAERDEGMSIDAYANIAAQQSVRLHCAVAVARDEGVINVTLTVDETKYVLTYTMGDPWVNRIPIGMNQTVDVAGFATLTLEDVLITEDLVPPDTSGSYNHYRPDSADNVYVAVQVMIQNQKSVFYTSDGFVAVHAVIDHKPYAGFVVLLDPDEQGFSSNVDLAPAASRTVYALIEVPKSAQDQSMQLVFFFGGQEYLYSN